ncbi:MAG: phosphoribosylanthranilate isomerase [Pseudomonadota bacterium]
MKPTFITFTGIDDRTDLYWADELATQYPIEWGVLYSISNQDARYPCAQAIDEILDITGQKAAHLCGRYARETAASGTLPHVVDHKRISRAQLNGAVYLSKLEGLEQTYGVRLILQRKDTFAGAPVSLLLDASGGQGVMPEHVPPRPPHGPMCGYAGGMGPETVLQYIDMIGGPEVPYWIDMETHVRTDGWFDLGKVQRVCELVYGNAG